MSDQFFNFFGGMVWKESFLLSLHKTNLWFGLCLPKRINGGAVAGWLV